MYVVFLRTQIGKAQFVGATDLWIKGVLVLSKKLGDPECACLCLHTATGTTWSYRHLVSETTYRRDYIGHTRGKTSNLVDSTLTDDLSQTFQGSLLVRSCVLLQ